MKKVVPEELRDLDAPQELGFMPSAASISAGWYEPKLGERQAAPEGRVPVLRRRISDGGRRWRAVHGKPLLDCHNLRLGETKEPIFERQAVEAAGWFVESCQLLCAAKCGQNRRWSGKL